MIKKFKFGIIGVLSISLIIFIAVFGLNASSANDTDIDAIKNVLIKSSTIAEKVYIDAKKSQKDNTLKDKKDSIVKNHSENFADIFSDKIDEKMKEAWIDRQVENVQDGPDLVDCGITAIELKDISIKDDTANVTAIVSKYLVERIIKNGKPCLDRLEGKIMKTATLVKNNGKWKITEYESNPDLNSTTHIITEEN